MNGRGVGYDWEGEGESGAYMSSLQENDYKAKGLP